MEEEREEEIVELISLKQEKEMKEEPRPVTPKEK